MVVYNDKGNFLSTYHYAAAESFSSLINSKSICLVFIRTLWYSLEFCSISLQTIVWHTFISLLVKIDVKSFSVVLLNIFHGHFGQNLKRWCLGGVEHTSFHVCCCCIAAAISFDMQWVFEMRSFTIIVSTLLCLYKKAMPRAAPSFQQSFSAFLSPTIWR